MIQLDTLSLTEGLLRELEKPSPGPPGCRSFPSEMAENRGKSLNCAAFVPAVAEGLGARAGIKKDAKE